MEKDNLNPNPVKPLAKTPKTVSEGMLNFFVKNIALFDDEEKVDIMKCILEQTKYEERGAEGHHNENTDD